MFVPMIVALIAVFAILSLLRAAIGYVGVRRDGSADFHYRKDQGLLPRGLDDADDFSAAYKQAHGPRGALFFGIGAAIAAALTYPILGIWVFIFEHGWRLAGQPREFEPGYLVWQFMLFGAMIVTYAMIAWLTARLYHS